MAVKRPLIHENGDLKELPTADILPVAMVDLSDFNQSAFTGLGGSFLFVDPGETFVDVITDTKLFWDNTNDRLSLNRGTSPTYTLDIVGDVGIEKTADAGAVTNVTSLDVSFNGTDISSVITNLKLIELDVTANAGTFTNTYGLYIGDITAGTQTNQAYGVYQEDTGARNFFAGNTGFGIAAPSYQLESLAEFAFGELSADPANPAEGKTVVWQSDGTGTGDDGDIYLKTTAGASTKTIRLTDFANGNIPGASTTLHNYAATANPAVGDDDVDGYSVGSIWINVTADDAFICLDASTGAAVWAQIDGGGGGILNKLNATVAPAVGDDNVDGYEVGSLWIDVTADNSYICVDASTGAAVWLQINDNQVQPTIETGATYSTTNSDFAGNIIRRISHASGCAVTVTAGHTNKQPLSFIQTGAGQLTFVEDTGVTIESADGDLKTRVQYSSAQLIPDLDTSDLYYLIGDITT